MKKYQIKTIKPHISSYFNPSCLRWSIEQYDQLKVCLIIFNANCNNVSLISVDINLYG